MAVVFSNNAATTLAASVTSSATSITVQDGSVFPTLNGSDYTYITLEDLSGDTEIVKLTARSGNTLTVVRAQDGTSARAFSNASKCELRLTAALLNEVAAQADTDTNTTYSVQDGELSENNFTDADHSKLDGIATSANNYTHPSAHSIGFITGLQTALDGKVDDSQVLTNVPSGALFTDTVYTLPFTDNSATWNTAYGWGDHSTESYATETYVGNQITALVDSSPATMDTLNELAAALGDDPNFATTVSTSIGTKWTQDNTKISQWNTAYGWGDHASAGYLTSYTDTNTTYSAGTGVTLTGTTFSLTDTNSKLNLSGGTLTGNLVVEDSEVHVGDISGDSWTRIKHAQADGYGFDFVHDNATVLVNEQGSTNEALVLGDVDANNSYSGLFGISHSSNSGVSWTKKLDLRGDGDLYVGSSAQNKVWHEGTLTTTNKSNYDTAFGWGNHASAGYLTSYTDTNTTYSAGTGVTLTGTTFSLTDTNAKLNLSGGTMTGDLTISTGNLNIRTQNEENPTDVIYLGANNGNGSGTSNDIGTGLVFAPQYSGYSKRSAGIMQIGEGNYFRSGLAFYTNNTSNATTDWSERMRLTMEGNLNLVSGSFTMGGTTVIDSSRNISNVNAISIGQDISVMDTTNLDLDIVNHASIRGASALYFGVTTNNYNSWKTRIGSNNTSTMSISGAATSINGFGYNTAVYGLFNSSGLQILGNTAWHAGNDGSGSGLDADLLDGYPSATAATANTVVVRDSNAHITGNYILGSYFNSSSGNSENPTIGQIWTQSTGDNYLRKSTPTHFASQMGSHLVRTDGSNAAFVKVPSNYTGNLNSISNAGVYFTEGTGSISNNPFGTSGSFLQFGDAGGTDVRLQFYAKSSLDRIAFRNQWGNGNWGTWKEFWTDANDGSGSGLDADLLDGLQGSRYVANQDGSRYTTEFNTILTSGFYNAQATPSNAPGAYGQLIVAKGIDTGMQIYGGYNNDNLWFRGWASSGATLYPWRKVWHDANDGSGSGLDADLLDGQHGSYYAAASSYLPLAGGTITGNLNVNGTTTLGNGPSDQTHINDTLYLGATDSGDSHFYFGENSSNWYGDHWYWDSGHEVERYSRHAGTDTLIEKHDTRYTHKVQTNRAYERLAHSTGYQIGSYNSVAANSTKTNPIYTIGDSYRPSDTSVAGMYGIGYAHSNLWGTGSGKTSGWGQYVVEAGAYTQIFSVGGTWSLGEFNRNGNKVWDAGNDGAGSGLDADLLDGLNSTHLDQRAYNSSNAYLGSHYINGGTGQKPNNSLLGAGKLKLSMQNSGNLGFGGSWNDVLWMSSYTGTDVKRSTAIVSSKYDTTSLFVAKQNYDSASWGTGYLLWNTGNDGSGSGLDADYVDGVEASSFLRSDANDTATGDISFNGQLYFNSDSTSNYTEGARFNQSTSGWGGMAIGGIRNSINGISQGWWFARNPSGQLVMAYQTSGNAAGLMLPTSGYNLQFRSQNVWNAGNDGAGSGLDADLLDGQQGSYYHSQGSTGMAGTSRITSISNFNNTLPSGWYQSSSASNKPGTSWYNMMNVRHSNAANDHGFQIAMSYYDNNFWSRSYQGGTGANNGSYQAWAKSWTTANDGSGSGLDADLLDGIQASSFLRSDASDTASGQYTFTKVNDHAIKVGTIRGTVVGSQSGEYIQMYNRVNIGSPNGWGSRSAPTYGLSVYGSAEIATDTGTLTRAGHLVWDAGNDGAGSGLDADLLDGYNSDNFLGKFGNSYFQANTWIQHTGQHGLYAPTINDAHFYPNTAGSYGTWRINGSRGGYTGIYLNNGGGVVTGMYDAGGNGGDYSASATGGWHYYYHRANRCLAVGNSTTSSSYGLYEQGGGIYSTGNITAYSDRRVKENIRTIDNALETVEQMRGVYYNRIDDEEKKTVIGFIAQEVDKVEGAKPLVTYAEDVDQYGVSYGNTAALLVEAVKELSQQVKDLKKEIKKLKEIK